MRTLYHIDVKLDNGQVLELATYDKHRAGDRLEKLPYNASGVVIQVKEMETN